MDSATSEPVAAHSGAADGFRRLKRASFVGLLGQLLIWGSAIALWVVGSTYSSIPNSTKIVYGANGFTVSAGAIFDINYLLVVGAAVSLVSLVLTGRAFQKVAKGSPAIRIDPIVSLTTIGTIGFGMFAVGWAVWLGSFVPPGASNGDAFDYAPVLASNLSAVVDLLLVLGGLLAFIGMLGIAWGSSTFGTSYDEASVEFGGTLSVLPVFSIVGYVLLVVGLVRVQRKLERGWTPPPPPPVPAYALSNHPAGYPGAPPIVVAGPQGSWDGLAVVLVVCLLLLWVFVLPFSLLLASSGVTHGPGATPGGGNGTNAASPAPAGSPSVIPILLIALAATALILPLAIVRNRRKRQRSEVPPVPPPPPPAPPPPPPAREDDPLDHLV